MIGFERFSYTAEAIARRTSAVGQKIGSVLRQSPTFEDVIMDIGPLVEWIGDDDPWMLKSTAMSLRWELEQDVSEQTVVGRAILAAHARVDECRPHEATTTLLPGNSES